MQQQQERGQWALNYANVNFTFLCADWFNYASGTVIVDGVDKMTLIVREGETPT